MSDRTPHPHDPPPRDERRPGGPGHGTDRPRRSRVRRLLPLAAAAWVVLEIWLLLVVAGAAGGLTVLGLLVGAFVLGALAIKHAGRRAWRRLAATLQAEAEGGRGASGAAQEAAGSGGGNALAMFGGLLLMVPGLVSDVAGLLCLFPPTAALLRRGAERLLTRGELGEAVQQARSAQQQARMRHDDGRIVQGEVVRDDDPPAR